MQSARHAFRQHVVPHPPGDIGSITGEEAAHGQNGVFLPVGFLIEMSCETLRSLLALRSHEAMGMLGAQEVMMQVSYPLPAGNRHIQIFYAILDVH
jgi:hypothetical protein